LFSLFELFYIGSEVNKAFHKNQCLSMVIVQD